MDSSKLIIVILSITITILLLIVAMVTILLLARRKGIQEQLKVAMYVNRLNAVTLESLRAQMNPHFIFNCLNSIKLYTEQNNSAAAVEYLDKFAKLIRGMLENARSDTNTLSSEIQTLQLYMDMEAMRFKDKMSYQFIIDENLDADFIEIPTLLIQPYVENAIWHGIMHKESSGKVILTILQTGEYELTISVEDNGVGRERAQASKSTHQSQHRSYGTKITEDRIALLNEKMKGVLASVVITDLFHDSGSSSGTLVTIKLPLK